MIFDVITKSDLETIEVSAVDFLKTINSAVTSAVNKSTKKDKATNITKELIALSKFVLDNIQKSDESEFDKVSVPKELFSEIQSKITGQKSIESFSDRVSELVEKIKNEPTKEEPITKEEPVTKEDVIKSGDLDEEEFDDWFDSDENNAPTI